MTHDQIYAEIRDTLVQDFDVDASAIKPEARLFQDLDLDSIDAIDMAVKLQEMTGKRVEEDALRQLRTVQDVVALVERTLAERNAESAA